MKKITLDDKAYKALLKPYYENLIRVNASFGSLFSVNKENFYDMS